MVCIFCFHFAELNVFYKTAFGYRDRRLSIRRGKMLGGSGAINLGAYTRGNRRCYDNWAQQYGATGWSYSEVLQYFLRSENNTDPAVVAANPHCHSTQGPLEISTVPNPDPIQLRMRDAAHRLGWPLTDFSNMEEQYGTSILQATQSATNWTRQSTASAFVEVNIDRPNLHVLVNSYVTKIIFNNHSGTPTATGVEFIQNNHTLYQVNATKEVIISAGPINTPQLLMLSGVGPDEHLALFDIPLVVDLPVGNNLYDHLLVALDYFVKNESDINWSGRYFDLDTQSMYNFLRHQTGPLTRLSLLETYIATGINGDRNWPDGMMYLIINQICK